MWAIKGRYEDALEDNDDVIWIFDSGQDKLHLLVVSNLFLKKRFSNIMIN